MLRALAPLSLILLAACGPVSREQAERDCFQRARLAQQPRGEVGIGVNSNGKTAGRLELNVSSDWVQGKDPAALYETCVFTKSGEPPARPLYDRPDWKG